MWSMRKVGPRLIYIHSAIFSRILPNQNITIYIIIYQLVIHIKNYTIPPYKSFERLDLFRVIPNSTVAAPFFAIKLQKRKKKKVDERNPYIFVNKLELKSMMLLHMSLA